MSAHGLIFKALFSLILTFSLVEASQETVKAAVAPYLLPEDHPIKPTLDAIFSSSRAIFNVSSLKKAGFKKAKPRKFTKLVVTTHPAVPGYIFKIYLDAQRFYKEKPEHYFWILRVQGAEKVRQEIAANNFDGLFKVPKKWIYELPENPKPPSGYYTKHYILVEEDMDLVPSADNVALWGSEYVTPSLLYNLFVVLTRVGLLDCAKPDNIPFSRDGRIAFVDTQTFDREVSYESLDPYLSKPNKQYWREITDY